MEEFKLCESDYRFMKLIWEHEPIPSGKLVAVCKEELGWKKSTTYTMLKKMSEKGFAKNEDSVVTALISRNQVQAYESERFVERAFDGSLPGFLASFLGGKTISEKEAKELIRLIDEHKEG